MKKCVILDADGVNPGDLSWDAIAGVTDLTVHNIYPSTPREEVLSRIGDAELVLLNKMTPPFWRKSPTSAISGFWPPDITWWIPPRPKRPG